MINDKFQWIGITEEFKCSMNSFKNHFGLDDFYYEVNVTNSNLANKDKKDSVNREYNDFIYEMNKTDLRLYSYVKEYIWPKYKKEKIDKDYKSKDKNIVTRNINTLLFHLNRQLKFRTEELKFKNIKRFYRRWYR